MGIAQRLHRLRQQLTDKGLNAVLLTQPDNCRYISGFTGSSGPAAQAIRNLDASRPIHYERMNSVADIDSTMYPSVEWLLQEGERDSGPRFDQAGPPGHEHGGRRDSPVGPLPGRGAREEPGSAGPVSGRRWLDPLGRAVRIGRA